ncbi:alpha/beta fold hydrolase [Microbacterium ulmi]|uniref:Alpha/beta hydrolase n=1 Tax=Microbacterium ulmi TaxID=179095 RepID=A0A7Y2M0K3_9MICO|nr:alpha/beta hydrolase [Microbacterium ulmi]NII70854.1 pimeloyl-ACP methyl ester carboxylesterase [Microbacterium ulmi]NNH02868.1 alpha/beta hydrolase [Microbacterium ulmi]
MDVILVPGLWLDASSWDDILPALEAAGHRPRPLTMPGVGASASESGSIGIADWVAAVVGELDALAAPAVLVGHSGGGNVVWGAADARPDKVARVVFVDTVPPAPGADISEFDTTGGVVPFPGWEVFDDEEVFDLDADVRALWARRALPVPARVPTDTLALHDARRFGVPVTILSGGLTAETLPEVLAQWSAWATEFGAISDTEVVHLGTGHWPQFSKPAELAQAIVAAIR